MTQVTLNNGSVDSAGALALKTNGTTTAVTIDTSQNVGIGVVPSVTPTGYKYVSVGATGNGIYGYSSFGVQLTSNAQLSGSTWQYAYGTGSNTAARIDMNDSAAGFKFFTAAAGTGGSTISWTQAMTLDSSGNLLVGTTSTVNPGGVTGTASFKTASSSKWVGAFENSASSSPWGVGVYFSGAAPNGTSNAFFYGTDTGGDRFFMRSNGGLANYSANNANLSDERTKTDIQDAGSYLAKICAIPVRTFKYKDQTDDLLNLGVIAQEVEAIAPELVDVSGFGETPEDGIPLKAIYQTDLQYALMKCIQEQQALINNLTERLAALEAK